VVVVYRAGDAVVPPGGLLMVGLGPGFTKRADALKETYESRRRDLEDHRLVRFPLAAYRRYQEMEGKHLSLVVAVNLFIAIIPLMIVGYAIIEAFNPNRSIGTVLVGRFHLTGDTAQIVRSTFSSARAGRSVALSISLISLLITGFDLAATIGTAYARSFHVQPPRGVQKYVRGGAWLLALLVMTSVVLTVRYWASSRPWWFLALALPVSFSATFGFYLVTPRLVLDLPFAWRDLRGGALICTVIAGCMNVASTFLLRNWFSGYGHAYGAFGVSLALMSWIGILSAFWVWIAAAQGVYWERKVSTEEALAIEQESEERLEPADSDD
jgi:uncharacterized BrkB/YihY/UPF0761 family membrane protein